MLFNDIKETLIGTCAVLCGSLIASGMALAMSQGDIIVFSAVLLMVPIGALFIIGFNYLFKGLVANDVA